MTTARPFLLQALLLALLPSFTLARFETATVLGTIRSAFPARVIQLALKLVF